VTDKLMELAARCEAAEGPDRELDASIWLATTEGATRERWDYTHKATGKLCHMDETRDASRHLITVPAYTASLDAAMTLVPEHCCWLAGDYKGMANTAFWQGRHQYARGWASVSDTGEPPGDPAMPTYRSHAMTPALALCAAALRALAQQENEDG
jgi:hypothetical protein